MQIIFARLGVTVYPNHATYSDNNRYLNLRSDNCADGESIRTTRNSKNPSRLLSRVVSSKLSSPSFHARVTQYERTSKVVEAL